MLLSSSECVEKYGSFVFSSLLKRHFSIYSTAYTREKLSGVPTNVLHETEVLDSLLSYEVGFIGLDDEVEYKVTCKKCSNKLIICRKSVNVAMVLTLEMCCDYCNKPL